MWNACVATVRNVLLVVVRWMKERRVILKLEEQVQAEALNFSALLNDAPDDF